MDKILIPMLNINHIAEAYAETVGAQVIPGAHYTTFNTPGFFYSRNIIDKPFAGDVKALIAEIMENSAKGIPALTTFTKELMPDGSKELFEAAGFKELLTQEGMILDSCDNIGAAPVANIERFSTENLGPWIDTMLEGFIEEGKQREDVVYNNLSKRDDMYFLGYVEEGKVLGTLLLHLRNEYSGIHEVAVPPAQRGRGISKKLLTHALQLVKENGCKGVTLQASDMGRPVYETMDFYRVSTIHTMALPS